MFTMLNDATTCFLKQAHEAKGKILSEKFGSLFVNIIFNVALHCTVFLVFQDDY